MVDLSAEDARPGEDIRAAFQAAFDAALLFEPLLFLAPSDADASYLRSGNLTLAVPGVEICGYGACIFGSDEQNIGLGLEAG